VAGRQNDTFAERPRVDGQDLAETEFRSSSVAGHYLATLCQCSAASASGPTGRLAGQGLSKQSRGGLQRTQRPPGSTPSTLAGRHRGRARQRRPEALTALTAGRPSGPLFWRAERPSVPGQHLILFTELFNGWAFPPEADRVPASRTPGRGPAVTVVRVPASHTPDRGPAVILPV
jgi:hypothetical protein